MHTAPTMPPISLAPPPRDAWDRAEHLLAEPGTFDDYRSLAAFHYRAAAPATIDRVLRLVDLSDAGGPVLAGVLVVSFPALYGVCRRLAWPHRFRGRTDYRDAPHLNRLLRTISRVIVDPRYRGMGAASRLVRTYLSDPATPLTEAISAMGRFCPFFSAAGMTPHELPRSLHDRRLARLLRLRRIPPWQLLDLAQAARCAADPQLREALLAWARRGGGGARRQRPHEPIALAQLAGAALTARPVMYSHGK